ncbi:MAG: peptidoglycan DD-metalloendopeptidase family protein [Acidimicrobiales bacterium]
MTKHRLALGALILTLVAVLVAPAGAADGDARAQRDKARRDKAALAADLDALNASEVELQRAVDALASEVAGQRAQVQAARQAVAAAEAEVVQAEADLAATTAAIAALKALLVERAVASFVAPADSSFHDVLQAEDPAEAGRKQAFLDQVIDKDTDIVDQHQAAEEDQRIARQAAESARQRAEDRRSETQSRLGELEGALAEQAKLKSAVDTRQAGVLAEIDQLSSTEAQLSALIERRIREAAEREARSAASATGGSAGGVTSGGCVWPARGPVTSEYGNRWGRLHAGIDIGARVGAQIWAAKAGTVVVSGSQGGYGNTIVIDHGGGMTTLYAHQSRLVAGQGQRVSQGQLIGYVGNTGNSTGPHLHFETRYGGTPKNPRGCLG